MHNLVLIGLEMNDNMGWLAYIAQHLGLSVKTIISEY